MIIYNIRKNGPYEYDKFILNLGQLYNKLKETELKYNNHEIHSLIKIIDEMTEKITYKESVLNDLLLFREKSRRRNKNGY